MIQFIETNEFDYSDGQISLLKANRVILKLEQEKMEAKLARANRLISQEIDLSKENSLIHIEIARQKVRALTAALEQLKGVK